MICHVCEGQASGQCKECLRFYCPKHGDIRCVECRGIQVEMPPTRTPDPPPRPAYRAPSVAQSGSRCYACIRTAKRACTRCGNFYCENHGLAGWGNLCESCGSSERVWGCIAAVVLVVCFLIVDTNFHR